MGWVCVQDGSMFPRGMNLMLLKDTWWNMRFLYINWRSFGLDGIGEPIPFFPLLVFSDAARQGGPVFKVRYDWTLGEYSWIESI